MKMNYDLENIKKNRKQCKASLLEKISYSLGLIAALSLGVGRFIPASLKINNQKPVIQTILKDSPGFVYACYDFDKNGDLDLINAHFKLADHTMAYFEYEVKKESKIYNYLQKRYEKSEL